MCRAVSFCCCTLVVILLIIMNSPATSVVTIFAQRLRRSSQMPTGLAFRVSILFVGGTLMSTLYNHLLKQHHVYTISEHYPIYLGSVWWIPLWAGTGVVTMGMALPYYDKYLGVPHTLNREWPSVIRCVGLTIGLFYACAKLPNVTNVQMSLLMSFLALFMWWVFDRSEAGLRLSLVFTVVGTIAMQGLVYSDIIRYTQPDFLLVRSWIPAMMFSAAVTFGTFGRQLAIATGSYFDQGDATTRTKWLTATFKPGTREKAD